MSWVCLAKNLYNCFFPKMEQCSELNWTSIRLSKEINCRSSLYYRWEILKKICRSWDLKIFHQLSKPDELEHNFMLPFTCFIWATNLGLSERPKTFEDSNFFGEKWCFVSVSRGILESSCDLEIFGHSSFQMRRRRWGHQQQASPNTCPDYEVWKRQNWPASLSTKQNCSVDCQKFLMFSNSGLIEPVNQASYSTSCREAVTWRPAARLPSSWR